MRASTDFLIIGAGWAGMVVAERLANAGWHCTVVDRRPHLGGNAYDETDAAGVLVHRYGPHYFRTNSPRIRNYLSRFTQWREVAFTIKSHTHGRYWSFPINLNTFEEFLGRPATTTEFTHWINQHRIPCENPTNSEEAILAQTGRPFYERFFEGYTLKQWQRHPRDLDPSVCGRVPIRTNRDDRYLNESFQALPDKGYTALFERMLDLSPNIDLHLGIDLHEARTRWRHRHLVFTGAIDEFFNHRLGHLPYRSLRFEPESFSGEVLAARTPISGIPGFWQPAVQVNYPDPHVPWTRVVEIKHATGQQIDATTIVREFPKEWQPGAEPFYPIPAPETRAAYQQYAQLAAQEPQTSFIGRLATYRYYNMDQVIGMALAEASRLLTLHGSPATRPI